MFMTIFVVVVTTAINPYAKYTYGTSEIVGIYQDSRTCENQAYELYLKAPYGTDVNCRKAFIHPDDLK